MYKTIEFSVEYNILRVLSGPYMIDIIDKILTNIINDHLLINIIQST